MAAYRWVGVFHMNRQPGDELRGICRIDAWAVADAGGVKASPASLLIDVGKHIKVLAVDTPEQVDRHPAAARARVIDRSGHVLIPGLINAHTHLDLTHIGPQPHDPEEGFVAWVDRIREARHADDEAIAASVRRGIELCRAGGTVAVGDIAGGMSLAPLRECRRAGMEGVSFLEFFAIGNREQAGIEALAPVRSDASKRAACAATDGLRPPAARPQHGEPGGLPSEPGAGQRPPDGP